ncbi:hypothetical protein [Leadbetterella sp. DM7]|uniref:hypothetical protein n=1 Tax=Leadbetterella sp. DM7 TaxID=3235085 RepID=UPI00349E7920
MKITKIFLLALVPFLSQAQDANAVIEKYLEATGGKDKIEDVTTFKYNRAYVANATTDYDEEVVVVGAKNQLSRKKTLLKRDFYYILNGNEGWIKIPMGSPDKKATYSTKDLSDKELSELSLEAKDGVLPFVNYDKKGYKLTAPVSAATIEGKATTRLAIEKDGLKREYYFDNATGLVVREVLIENGITHTMDYTRYDTTPIGVKLPVAYTYINTKDKRKTNVTTKWTFDKPAEGVAFTK